MMLTNVVDKCIIRGVYVEETGDQLTHGQFADDTHITIEAK